MKDKTIKATDFSTKNVILYIFIILFVLIEIVSIIGIIVLWNEQQTNRTFWFFSSASAIDVLPLMIVFYIRHQKRSTEIHFRQNYLYIPGAKWSTAGVIQFETRVEYRKIIGIDLTYSHHTSRYTEPDVMPGVSSIAAAFERYPYIDLYLKNRKIERILLSYYTKKQWKEILTQIKLRVSKHNTMLDDMDIDKMLNDFKYAFFEKNPYDNFKELIEKYNEAKRQK